MAQLNIAGITNKNNNILGLMPHPERAIDDYSNQRWSNVFQINFRNIMTKELLKQ